MAKTFTAEERAAMKERAREAKASKADGGESDVLAKIAEMPRADRVMAERLHALVKASAPGALPQDLVRHARVRQGRQGRLLLPERGEVQVEVRDGRLQRPGQPGQGAMWPTSYALTELTPAEEKKIATLVKKAVR